MSMAHQVKHVFTFHAVVEECMERGGHYAVEQLDRIGLHYTGAINARVATLTISATDFSASHL